MKYFEIKFPGYAGTEITDFEMPDKTSNTIKYLLDILKIHWVSYSITP